MKQKDFEALGKWLAVSTCIVMAGILTLHGKSHDASNFGWAAFLIAVLA